MNEREFEQRLTRIEGLLSILVRHADIDIEGEIAKAYRRGYNTGHHQRMDGRPFDPDRAIASRRRSPRSEAEEGGAR